MRPALLLLLLAASGCRDEDEISILNTGAEPVLAEIEWRQGDWGSERRRRFVEIPAGAVYSRELGWVDELDVLIRRKSDGLILFAEDYDAEDLDDDHGHVEIAVTP